MDQFDATRDENLDMSEAIKRVKGLTQKNETPSEKSDEPTIVEMEDGTRGWVIEHESPEERQKRLQGRVARAMELTDPNDSYFANTASKERLGKDPLEVLMAKKGPHNEDVRSIMRVKEAFAGMAPTVKGAGPVDSPDAIRFRQAMEDLRSGKVVLPTVEEYERQKKELEKERNEIMDTNTPVSQAQQTQAPVQNPTPVTPPVMGNGAPAPNALPPKRGEADIAARSAQKAQPINLARMKEQHKAAQNQQPTPPTAPVAPVNNEPQNVVQFDVAEGQTKNFYASLPDEDKKKVSTAKVIQIKETDLREVPTSVRTINSLAEYRRITPRRIHGEYVEVALPNSGYVATMGAAGSLEMATILPDIDTTNNTAKIDYQKRYQFCFNHLIDTSIGMLSFSDFCNQTAYKDIEAMIGAIYRASQPPKQKIQLTCGNPKCGKDYEITFETNNLVDIDAFDNETKMMINTVIEARDIEGRAKEVHDNSPVMLAKTFKLDDDTYAVCKQTDGNMMIERGPLIEPITKRYGQLVAAVLLFVKEVRKLLVPEGMDQPDWFTITDPTAIAEELFNLMDDQLDILIGGVESLDNYDEYQYAFKGPYHCPHCGREEKKVSCPLDELVFRKVSRAVNRG